MNTKLLEQVLQSPRLPSLPSVAVEVIDLVQQQDVNIKRIAHTIQHDPALACKILRTVNSSFYGQAYSVSTVTHALVVLGLNSVKTLALGFSLVGNLRQSGGESFDHQTYWRRSLYTATAAKPLAQHAGLPQQEEAFLGGLLQDMGMVAMNQVVGPDYAPLLAEVQEDHHALHDLEQAKLGLTHRQVGAALAESWKLPPLLVGLIRDHESPESADEDLKPLVRAVALGNLVAQVFMKGQSELDAAQPSIAANDEQRESANDPSALESFYHQAQAWFGLARDRSEPLLKEIHGQTADMARLFDLPAGGVANPDAILGRANEALMNLTLQTQQQQSELQRKNQQLNVDANTDALTHVPNRRAFDQYLTEQSSIVSAEAPLSVLFVDVDEFKDFNDTYGHAVGDDVLIAVARTLSQALGDHGNVFRYGGEEFAIICPMTTRRTAAGIAERLRQAVEIGAKVCDEQGTDLYVTVSVGAACDGGQAFESAGQLVKAADHGVYAAKAAGRNCVRVFSPKPTPAAA